MKSLLTALLLALLSFAAPATDWPQWGGTDNKNMVSEEKGLPDSFVPGEKNPMAGRLMMETTKNVKWGVKLCSAIYSTPVISNGQVYIGGQKPGAGLLALMPPRPGT